MLKVLVVDDQRINRMLVEALVKASGQECFQAEGGREAIHILRTDPMDLVLMDIEMPEMDGMETAKMIRERELIGPDVPIVAVTAHSGEDDKAAFKASGMQGYVQKPINADKLQEVYAEFNLL